MGLSLVRLISSVKARFVVLFAHIVCDTCLSDPCQMKLNHSVAAQGSKNVVNKKLFLLATVASTFEFNGAALSPLLSMQTSFCVVVCSPSASLYTIETL